MSRKVSMQFGRNGGVVQNRPGWKFVRGGDVLDDTTEVLNFAAGGIYILVCVQWTADGGARQGRQVSLICAPEEELYGTVASTREALVTGGTARVSYTLNADSTLSIVQSSAAYNWRYALYRVDASGGSSEQSELEPYTGSYSVTPTTSAQSLSTANKRMTADLEVDEIPPDFGQVSQSGDTLSIS